jgi:hypothetical protein
MPSDDPDKIYIKKFKINSLLNDLFTILTQNKPDDPIEYCLQHFESKLDPEKKAARVERKASVDGEISNKSAIDNMSALNILSQLNIMVRFLGLYLIHTVLLILFFFPRIHANPRDKV